MNAYDEARRSRSKDSRLYLISNTRVLTEEETNEFVEHRFEIHGTRGNTYTVTTSPKTEFHPRGGRGNKWRLRHTCTCPDFMRRDRICKHIYFVYHRALHFEEDYNLDIIPKEVLDNHLALFIEKAFFEKKKKTEAREIEEHDECVICFDLLLERPTDHCRSCLNSLHKDCIFFLQKSSHKKCPLCRSKFFYRLYK